MGVLYELENCQVELYHVLQIWVGLIIFFQIAHFYCIFTPGHFLYLVVRKNHLENSLYRLPKRDILQLHNFLVSDYPVYTGDSLLYYSIITDCTTGWYGSPDVHGYTVYFQYHTDDGLKKSQSVQLTSQIMPSVRIQQVTRKLLGHPFTPCITTHAKAVPIESHKDRI